jgi:hypothetical protein
LEEFVVGLQLDIALDLGCGVLRHALSEEHRERCEAKENKECEDPCIAPMHRFRR